MIKLDFFCFTFSVFQTFLSPLDFDIRKKKLCVGFVDHQLDLVKGIHTLRYIHPLVRMKDTFNKHTVIWKSGETNETIHKLTFISNNNNNGESIDTKSRAFSSNFNLFISHSWIEEKRINKNPRMLRGEWWFQWIYWQKAPRFQIDDRREHFEMKR